MGYSYRREPDLDFCPVHKRHVRDAICQDPRRCTLALAGKELLGYEVYAAIEEDTSEVRCTWYVLDESDPTQGRFHKAYLRPMGKAMNILNMTDANKSRLLRRIPVEGITGLRLEEHFSRAWHKRSKAQAERERARTIELSEQRARGEAAPAVSRPRAATPPRATSRGIRRSKVA